MNALATAVDVNTLGEALHGSYLAMAGVGIPAILAGIAANMCFVEVFSGPKTRVRKSVLFLLGVALSGCFVLAFPVVGSMMPDAKTEIDKSFAAEYPNLTMTPEDRDCIADVARNREDSCVATRKVPGGYADVKYTNYRGKFVITSSGGADVRSDADILAIDGASK